MCRKDAITEASSLVCFAYESISFKLSRFWSNFRLIITIIYAKFSRSIVKCAISASKRPKTRKTRPTIIWSPTTIFKFIKSTSNFNLLPIQFANEMRPTKFLLDTFSRYILSSICIIIIKSAFKSFILITLFINQAKFTSISKIHLIISTY